MQYNKMYLSKSTRELTTLTLFCKHRRSQWKIKVGELIESKAKLIILSRQCLSITFHFSTTPDIITVSIPLVMNLERKGKRRRDERRGGGGGEEKVLIIVSILFLRLIINNCYTYE